MTARLAAGVAGYDPRVRALVLSGPVGESHLSMARSLGSGVTRRDPGAAIDIRNDFAVLGPALGRRMGRGYSYHLGEVRWSYDLAYALFTRVRPARRLGELALYRAGGAGLAATIAEADPDVVVSTHPVINAVLGPLRASGRVRCPVALVVGPLGGLEFWVQPGADLHLLNYAEALPQVERVTGPGRATAVRPLVREEFFSVPTREQARAELAIPRERRLVLVSGGGWGAGDLQGAIGAGLAIPEAHVVAVTGRNEPLRHAIVRRHGEGGRVTVVGFTEQMREWLAAADVFVTATAGVSCLEAQLCGCRTVWYGFAAGHVRDNVAALARHGIVLPARTLPELTRRLAEALEATEAPVFPARAELPRAGDILVDLAHGGGEVVPREPRPEIASSPGG